MRTRTIFGATVLAILIFASCGQNKQKVVDFDSLISAYMTVDDIPSFTQRGSVDSVMNIIETSFNDKNYEAVNNIIISNQESFADSDKDIVYIYQGVSYAKRGMYTEAYDVLSNNEIYENSLYEQMANWYLAMSMMKTQNVSEAKKLLTSFANNPSHYKQEEAKEILRKM